MDNMVDVFRASRQATFDTKAFNGTRQYSDTEQQHKPKRHLYRQMKMLLDLSRSMFEEYQ